MLEGVEGCYDQLADSMTQAIPEEWTSASFEAIFFPNSSIYEAEYVRKEDGKARGFQPADSGDRAFRQLRKLFKVAGKPVWGKARFELQPDGTFNMHWGYDNCDTNGDTVFDEDKELKRREERRARLSQH